MFAFVYVPGVCLGRKANIQIDKAAAERAWQDALDFYKQLFMTE